MTQIYCLQHFLHLFLILSDEDQKTGEEEIVRSEEKSRVVCQRCGAQSREIP